MLTLRRGRLLQWAMLIDMKPAGLRVVLAVLAGAWVVLAGCGPAASAVDESTAAPALQATAVAIPTGEPEGSPQSGGAGADGSGAGAGVVDDGPLGEAIVLFEGDGRPDVEPAGSVKASADFGWEPPVKSAGAASDGRTGRARRVRRGRRAAWRTPGGTATGR